MMMFKSGVNFQISNKKFRGPVIKNIYLNKLNIIKSQSEKFKIIIDTRDEDIKLNFLFLFLNDNFKNSFYNYL